MPNGMEKLVGQENNNLGSTHFFNQSGLDFLRDAWIAAEFGTLRRAEKVRLVSDNWPDFELVVAGCVEAFEAVWPACHRRQCS